MTKKKLINVAAATAAMASLSAQAEEVVDTQVIESEIVSEQTIEVPLETQIIEQTAVVEAAEQTYNDLQTQVEQQQTVIHELTNELAPNDPFAQLENASMQEYIAEQAQSIIDMNEAELPEARATDAQNQKELSEAQAQLEVVQADIAQAQANSNHATAEVKAAETAKATAEAQLQALQASADQQEVPENHLTLPADYVQSLKDLQAGTKTAADTQAPIDAFLPSEGYPSQEYARQNYVKSASHAVDITKPLSSEDMLELNHFATSIINDLRAQTGTQPLTLNSGVMAVAKDIANNSQVENWHDMDAINAARKADNAGYVSESLYTPEIVNIQFASGYTLDDVKFQVYQAIVKFLYEDSHANFGHAIHILGLDATERRYDETGFGLYIEPRTVSKAYGEMAHLKLHFITMPHKDGTSVTAASDIPAPARQSNQVDATEIANAQRKVAEATTALKDAQAKQAANVNLLSNLNNRASQLQSTIATLSRKTNKEAELMTMIQEHIGIRDRAKAKARDFMVLASKPSEAVAAKAQELTDAKVKLVHLQKERDAAKQAYDTELVKLTDLKAQLEPAQDVAKFESAGEDIAETVASTFYQVDAPSKTPLKTPTSDFIQLTHRTPQAMGKPLSEAPVASETHSEESSKETLPNTGDTSSVTPAIGSLMSMVGLAGVIKRRKK